MIAPDAPPKPCLRIDRERQERPAHAPTGRARGTRPADDVSQHVAGHYSATPVQQQMDRVSWRKARSAADTTLRLQDELDSGRQRDQRPHPGLEQARRRSMPYISSPAKTAASTASSAQVTSGKRAFSEGRARDAAFPSRSRGARAAAVDEAAADQRPPKGSWSRRRRRGIDGPGVDEALEKMLLRLNGFNLERSASAPACARLR